MDAEIEVSIIIIIMWNGLFTNIANIIKIVYLV